MPSGRGGGVMSPGLTACGDESVKAVVATANTMPTTAKLPIFLSLVMGPPMSGTLPGRVGPPRQSRADYNEYPTRFERRLERVARLLHRANPPRAQCMPGTGWLSLRLAVLQPGRAAVERQALPPPGPSRTYETSELGARRSLGQVLNDQDRWVWGAAARTVRARRRPAAGSPS